MTYCCASSTTASTTELSKASTLSELDRKRMSVRKLAQTAGLHYPNVAAIFRGKPAAESTWQKLFDVAYPSILLEEGDGS